MLLVNPAARRGAAARHADVLRVLRRRWALEVVMPPSAELMGAAARGAAADGFDAVLVAGGDGTARVVATALAGSRVPIGLLPTGTANDFARALGIPRTLVAAAGALVTARPRAIDLLRAGERRICTVAGLGIVADSTLAAARLRAGGAPVRALARLAGGGIYRLTATAALLRPAPLGAPVDLALTASDGGIERLSLRTPGIFIAAQRFLGGGLRLPYVGPDDDGLMAVLVIHDVSRPRLLDAFTRLTLGRPIPPAVLSAYPVRAVRVHCAREETLVGDGDVVARARSFDVSVDAGALQVLVAPAGRAQPTRNSSSDRA